MEGAVKAEARIDIAREAFGRSYDCFQGGADEGIAMRLASGQGARVAAEEWQVRGEFLTKRHIIQHSITRDGFLCERARLKASLVAMRGGHDARASSPQRPSAKLEQSSRDLVSYLIRHSQFG